MVYFYSDRIYEYSIAISNKGSYLYRLVIQVDENELSIEEALINAEDYDRPVLDYRLEEDWFSFENLSREIRSNINECNDEFTLNKYLHYLIKVYKELYFNSVKNRTPGIKLFELHDKYYNPKKVSYERGVPEDDFFMLLNNTKLIVFKATFLQQNFGKLICEEFGLRHEDWEKLTLQPKIINGRNGSIQKVPDLKTISSIFNSTYENIVSETLKDIKHINYQSDSNISSPIIEKDKFNHKQQIILLEKLKFFELSLLQNLTIEQKGKLLSFLLNRNEKNSTEYFRNLSTDKKKVSKDAYFVKSELNLKKVDDLLKGLGLENI